MHNKWTYGKPNEEGSYLCNIGDDINTTTLSIERFYFDGRNIADADGCRAVDYRDNVKFLKVTSEVLMMLSAIPTETKNVD